VWYLGGYGCHLIGAALKASGEPAGWQAYWASARRWLRRCLKLFAAQEYEDEPLGEHARELLVDIAKEVGEVPEGEDDGDDDDWEDTEEGEGGGDGDGDGDDDGDEEMT